MPQTHSACVTSGMDGWMHRDRAAGARPWPGLGQLHWLGLAMELRFRAYDAAQGRADKNQTGLTRRQNH